MQIADYRAWVTIPTGAITPGTSSGEEFGGFWTCEADGQTVHYVCYAGKDPVDANGNSCNSNIKF